MQTQLGLALAQIAQRYARVLALGAVVYTEGLHRSDAGAAA